MINRPGSFFAIKDGGMKRILCVASIALLVSACAVTDRKNKLAVAAVTGGLAGAFVGWQVFGAGTSGLLGIFAIGGVSAGAAYLAADSLLPRDRESLHRATYHSLQDTPAGQPTRWDSPDSDATATITPKRNFYAKDGRFCREFNVFFRLGKSRETHTRTACRGFDGSWQTI